MAFLHSLDVSGIALRQLGFVDNLFPDHAGIITALTRGVGRVSIAPQSRHHLGFSGPEICMKRVISLFLGLLVSMTAASQGFDRPVGEPFASRSEVIAMNGMAATSQPLATQIALDILRRVAVRSMPPSLRTPPWASWNLRAAASGETFLRLSGMRRKANSPALTPPAARHNRSVATLPGHRDAEHSYLGPLTVSVPGAVDGW